jgi:hypothetical protein
MSDLVTRYQEIAEATKKVREKSLADLAPIGAAHAIVDEVRVWQTALMARPEAVIFAQVISTTVVDRVWAEVSCVFGSGIGEHGIGVFCANSTRAGDVQRRAIGAREGLLASGATPVC